MNIFYVRHENSKCSFKVLFNKSRLPTLNFDFYHKFWFDKIVTLDFQHWTLTITFFFSILLFKWLTNETAGDKKSLL